ncbi:hypothetical protein L1049_010182 [Liquidambar formosana]|uniref:Uncharacterized protein n=1 Tax=Liquidambar formosana TaxID=63359 RepID=A0AAP0R4N2_LIQFO
MFSKKDVFANVTKTVKHCFSINKESKTKTNHFKHLNLFLNFFYFLFALSELSFKQILLVFEVFYNLPCFLTCLSFAWLTTILLCAMQLIILLRHISMHVIYVIFGRIKVGWTKKIWYALPYNHRKKVTNHFKPIRLVN